MALEHVTEIKIYYESSTPYEIFSMDFSGGIIYPNSSFHIDLLEDQLTVSGDATFTGDNQNVVWDKSADSLEFADGAYAKFGTGNDTKYSKMTGKMVMRVLQFYKIYFFIS